MLRHAAPANRTPMAEMPASSLDGHRSHLKSRSNRRLFGIWHIQIILGKELDETGGDGGGIPARQVVARTRYRHRVDFWNPLLQ